MSLAPVTSHKTEAGSPAQTSVLTAGEQQGGDSNTLSLFQNPVLFALNPRPQARKECHWNIQKRKQWTPDLLLFSSCPYTLVIWTRWPRNFLVSVFAGHCSQNSS